MRKDRDSRYNYFLKFILEVTEFKKKSGKPIDAWLAAIGTILGPETLVIVAMYLEIEMGPEPSIAVKNSMPLLANCEDLIARGILLTKNLSIAQPEETDWQIVRVKEITSLFRAAMAAPSEYAKRKFVDLLFNDAIKDERPPY